jgi:hypothetical protein
VQSVHDEAEPQVLLVADDDLEADQDHNETSCPPEVRNLNIQNMSAVDAEQPYDADAYVFSQN